MWKWIKQAALILVGRYRSGADPTADASYGAVAIEDTTRELMALAQVRLNDGAVDRDALCDASGRLIAAIHGTLGSAILQDARGALVISESVAPGSCLAQIHLSTGANTLIFSAPGTQVFEAQQIVLTNDNGSANDVTLMLGNEGNTTRLHRQNVSASSSSLLVGPKYIVPGLPLRGQGTQNAMTVTLFGRRVR